MYKIDVNRALIYILGAVPGKSGNFVRIRDCFKKADLNEEFLNFPTFMPEKGKEYATEMMMEAPEEDPEEIYEHDNVHVKEDDKADTSTTTTTTPGSGAPPA